MKRLERMVDLIDIVGMEKNAERIPIQAEVNFSVPYEFSLDTKAQGMKAITRLLSKASNKVTLKKSTEVSSTDRKVVKKMIEQVQHINAVKVNVS